ncbi:ABC transporter substrate-binding protein [Futiania mangrovi]|uniref:ABC transporter substrate-binding protein n=1 Tax=Futiania mangrovi TaxID=2959716 RepID=A0A9J6PG68_9PROT|nr:ABC transporter substrate-binding protein [Futiania mangrovii]MCP1337729.1 ABC transporter substrate-binding protein [Futiania mangrovii]
MTKLKRLALAAVAAAALAWPAMAANTSLTMGMVLEPPHLDPTAGAAAAIDEVVYANVFEGLTRIDSTGAVQPALARSWEISEDGKVYTFKLAGGVTFHNGVPMTADHVVFSFERAMAEGSVNAQKQLFAPIETVEAVDPATVRITLKNPFGALLFNLGWGDAVIVEPSSADTNKDQPVGTGPFKLDRWVKGDRVEISAYDGYWGDKPALASATFKFISDPAAAVAAVLAGDVDAFANFPAGEALEQFRADPRFEVTIGSTEGETILAINNQQKPFDDVRVRRALSHAIDRKALIDGAMFGNGTPIGSHFAPHHPAYVDLTNRYPYDKDGARKLLAEAGYPDGFSATLKLPPPSYARRGGELIAAQLAEVGVKLEIIPVEWPQWLEQVFRGDDFDLTIVSHTEPMDIGIYARGTDYYFNYVSDEFNAIIDKLNLTAETEARYALMGDAQRKLADDAVNVFLFQLPKLGVWKAGLEGLWENSPVQANDLTGVRWTQ